MKRKVNKKLWKLNLLVKLIENINKDLKIGDKTIKTFTKSNEDNANILSEAFTAITEDLNKEKDTLLFG